MKDEQNSLWYKVLKGKCEKKTRGLEKIGRRCSK